MKRKLIMSGVTVLAAALALFWIVATLIGHMMEPSGGGIRGALQACAIAIVLIAIAALVLIYVERMSAFVLAVAVALMGIASIISQAIYSARHVSDVLDERAEKRALEAKVLAGLESRKQDIEARIAAKGPYTPEESLDFLFVVTGADLSNRLLSDHSDVAFALLLRALQEKIIDPNGWIQRPHWDSTPEPLFLYYYKYWARAGRRGPVDRLRWKIMRMLAENGADLTLPAAAWVVEDLAKPERPGVSKDWIALD